MTKQQKPILVRTTTPVKRYPVGAEMGFVSTGIADKQLGEGNYEIVRYLDGSAYEDAPADGGPKPISRMTRDELVSHGLSIGFTEAASFEGNKKQLIQAIQDFAADGAPSQAEQSPADEAS